MMIHSPLTDVFAPFAAKPGSVLLESSEMEPSYGRYSMMAVDPFLILEARCGRVRIFSAEGETEFDGDPIETLQTILDTFGDTPGTVPGQSRDCPRGVPYGPGAFGFLSYELGYELQNLPRPTKDDLHLPDLWFAFYDEVTCYDHLARRFRKASRSRRGVLDSSFSTDLQSVSEVPRGGEVGYCPPRGLPESRHPSARSSNYSASDSNQIQANYAESFDEVMEHIRAGNIYQLNLCRRFSTPLHDDPWEIYLALRNLHPTFYGAYLNTGRNVILSASPELFLKKQGDRIETRPIKGTALAEAGAEEKLRGGDKERAEHIMIVDLERNDLGRICKTGSIIPENLFTLEGCGNVKHLVSTVRGTLKDNTGLSEILRAAFPGGSVTGAPKRKAMEIIASLEPVVRGVYTGALGWIGFNGDFTFNLPIRTVLLQDGLAHAYFGGGVVADSTAEKEYQELLDKGEPFFKLLGISEHAPSMA